MDTEKIKITILIRDKNTLLANANVCFYSDFGMVTIKGFQIWKSNVFNERLGEGLNISPPSLQYKGGRVQLVFFESKEQWYELERLIYSKYLEKRPTGSEEVNIDEMPNIF